MKKIIAIILSALTLFGINVAAHGVEEATAPATPTPFEKGTAGSELFRIPAIITLKDGSVLAAADIRHNHGLDSPNNLDTLVAVSSDGYGEWKYTVVNHFDDYPDGVDNKNSASFIDSVIVQSEKTDTIFMLTDVFPSGGGAPNASKGTGYVTIDGKKRLALTDGDDITDFKKFGYYIDEFENGFAKVKKIADSSATAYTVDREYRLYKDGKNAVMQQNGTGKTVNQNVFYREADLTLYRTMYMALRKSTDGGKTWSEPEIITNQVKNDNESFFGVGPGRGLAIDINGKERILFPVYDNAGGKENISTIYSDDGGKTWLRGGETQVRFGLKKTSEGQLITLPDGTVRMFARCNNNFVAYADSTDGGVTWTKFKADTGFGMVTKNCMVSFINTDKKIDGKPVVIGSSAGNIFERADGIVRVGTIEEDKSINWISLYHVNSGFYAYSCLTELADGKIALLYEDEPYHIAYMILDIADDGSVSEINGNNIQFKEDGNVLRKIGTWFKKIIVRLQMCFKTI